MAEADPYLCRAWADMREYLVLERALCQCRGSDLCRCGWDDMEEQPPLVALHGPILKA